MLRHLFKAKKMRRKEANAAVVLPIYGRGADALPAEYLICHQEADAATATKLIDAAEKRRKQRNAKRLRQQTTECLGKLRP